jgi:hypothetical protein
MNTTPKIITLAVAVGIAMTSASFAEDVVATATVNTAGTISEFSPDTIVVRTESSPQPIRYRYSKTTTYVDEAGNPVSLETVKSGLPVTVYYAKDGDQMIANKVVVRRARTTTTVPDATATTTTTVGGTTNLVGTISEFSPDAIVVRSETSPEPVRYSYSKTTTYVDEAGNPVSLETVKSGLPVTVYYAKQGDRMIANKVIVRRTTTNAPVIEKKTTTTTTTESK